MKKDNMIIWKDYCITVDENSFTLYEKKIGKKGRATGKETLSLIGHYNLYRLDSLLKSIIHIELSKNLHGYVEIEEYMKEWRAVNEKLSSDLDHLMKPFIS